MTRATDDRGVALLVVLLAITLLTIVVVEFTFSAQVESHLALSGRNALQASYLARSGVNLGEAILARDEQMNDIDSQHDLWALPLPPVPIGDGTVAIRIRDEARFLNLNALGPTTDPKRRAVFESLFDVLGLDRTILAAIFDWLDDDALPYPSPPGAEQSYYLGLSPPRVVRNGPLLTVRELLLVRGVTPEVLAQLEPFVTALPGPGGTLKVNVNTAPSEVLYALAPAMAADTGLVKRLLDARDQEPLKGDFPGRADAAKGLTGRGEFTYTSTYFRIEAVGTVDDVRRGVVALVERTGNRVLPVKRVAWNPTAANLALTSQPASDFLEALPPLGDG